MTNRDNPPGVPPPHFVVIVPGYMGSRLRLRSTGKTVWLDLNALDPGDPVHLPDRIANLFETLAYPNDDIEPAGIMDQVVFAPPLLKQEPYLRLTNALRAGGYGIDPLDPRPHTPSVYTFAYDWRQDNRISARQLGRAIERWGVNHPGAQAWVIAHSSGGLAARWYIEKEGGKERVGRLFLMASPWDGVPRAVSVLHSGLEMAFMRQFNRFDIGALSRKAFCTFPSFYQLVPFHAPILNDRNDEKIDLFGDLRWMENDRHAQMLLDGRQFNLELGATLSVETLCFFGAGKPTPSFGRVERAPGGRWAGITWGVSEPGDGVVPERSAVHPTASQKLPFVASHGDIPVAPPVLEKLDWELQRKYGLGVPAEMAIDGYHIQFEPARDAYTCGETVDLWATIHEHGADGALTPLSGQPIRARLVLSEALPGQPAAQTGDLHVTALLDAPVEPGRYEGSLLAPAAPGYYRVVCDVSLPGRETSLQVEELIVVEGEPWPVMAETAAEGLVTKGLDLPGGDIRPPGQAETTRGLNLGGETGGRGPLNLDRPHFSFGHWLAELGGDEPAETTRGLDLGAEAVPEPDTRLEAAQVEQKRSIQYALLDQDAGRPLAVGEEFTLAFWVDRIKQGESRQAAFNEAGLFARGADQVTLKVVVTSTDFIVYTAEAQSLRVPETGKSKNKARFDLEPLHEGAGKLTALFFKDNNFVQGLLLTLNVGGPDGLPAIAGQEEMGRSLDGAFAIQARDLSLIIRKNVADTYTFTLVGPTVSEVDLKISDHLLNSLISEARNSMLEVLYLWEDANGKVNLLPAAARIPPGVNLAYQSGLKISDNLAREGLVRMARAGHRLFEGIFFSDGANPAAIALGRKLRELLLAPDQTYQLQIVSQDFLMPWGALYLISGNRFDPQQVRAENFVGFRHIIEHIPLQQSTFVTDPHIRSEPVLEISVNYDEGIDSQFGVSAVADQLSFFHGLPGGRVHLSERRTAGEFLDALGSPDNRDQILYFYGHAVSNQLGPGGPGSSSLQLSQNSLITLNDLKDTRPIFQMFNGAPLVFINACESAELSPLFYGGFMPYFVDRGARGMIGTECRVPVRFADEWARRFFRYFLRDGRPLGEVFLNLRREMLAEYNNLLGLLYALYCDGDTTVQPHL